MGSSASADLFYGYDLGDMTDHDTWESLMPVWMRDADPDDDEGDDPGDGLDWETAVAMRLGWVKVPYPPDVPDTPWNMPYEERRAIRKAFDETPAAKTWLANRQELHRLGQSLGVEMDTYGYMLDGDVSHYVKVIASSQSVRCYGSIEVAELQVSPEWDEMIARFMELLELPVPKDKKPGWHLNCSYG